METKRGTIKAASGFSATEDAQTLRKAMKGLGTDEDAIISVLAYRDTAQRQEIRTAYKTTIGRDLIDDLKSELSGKFERVIVGMMTPTVLYDVEELRRAMKVCALPLRCSPGCGCTRCRASSRDRDKGPLTAGGTRGRRRIFLC